MTKKDIKDLTWLSSEALTLVITNNPPLNAHRVGLAGYELEKLGYKFTDAQWDNFQNHLEDEE